MKVHSQASKSKKTVAMKEGPCYKTANEDPVNVFFLVVKDRIKELIKVNGNQVAPAEVKF